MELYLATKKMKLVNWKEMNGTKNECFKLGNTGSDKCHFFTYADLETIKRDTREVL